MPEEPTLAEFLAAPIETVRAVAPATLILTNGGTRRRAVLEGISPASDEYARWTRTQMIASLDLVFRHGVRHLFTTVLAETNYAEVTAVYRERLAGWTAWGLAGDEVLAEYARLGWRVRLVGAESWPALMETAQRLRSATAQHPGPTVWFTVASHSAVRWTELIEVIARQNVRTRAEAIRALYGEDVPPASVFIGSGKPQVFSSIVPPILIGDLQCYWRQHLGYDLDERTLRTILYDYAYLRNTWQQDKSNRAEEVLKYQGVWESPAVIGLGVHVGPFWYPAAMPGPMLEEGS